MLTVDSSSSNDILRGGAVDNIIFGDGDTVFPFSTGDWPGFNGPRPGHAVTQLVEGSLPYAGKPECASIKRSAISDRRGDEGINLLAVGLWLLLDSMPTAGSAEVLKAPVPTGGDDPASTTSYQWEMFDGVCWVTIDGATAATFLPTLEQVGMFVRAIMTFTDSAGNSERVVLPPSHVVDDQTIAATWPDSSSGSTGAIDIQGTDSNDILVGGTDDDVIIGGDGDDMLFGGAGDDTLLGGRGNDRLDGGTGHDIMAGGSGNDIYVVDSASDKVIESQGRDGGIDTVETTLDTYTLGKDVENLTLLSDAAGTGIGNELANTLLGGSGENTLIGLGNNDKLHGGAGDDVLDGGSGDDELSGGDGDDMLVGGTGADDLYGGAGNDIFYFAAGDAGGPAPRHDRIMDFEGSQSASENHDRIDFSGLHSILGLDTDIFDFIGLESFSGSGQLRYFLDDVSGNTIVEAKASGDYDALGDFQIEVVGIHNFINSDFLL